MLTLGFWTPGPVEIIVILVIGLLLFGRRLPEVGRSLGKSIVEFKRGIKDIEDDVDHAGRGDDSSKRLEQEAVARDRADARTVSRGETPEPPPEAEGRPQTP